MNKKIVKLILFLITSATLFAILLFLNNFLIRKVYPIPKKYINLIKQNSTKYKVDVPLILAVIKTESNFNESAVSSKGAVGLMQITPQTFMWLQKNENKKILKTEENLFDPNINIKYGVYLLSYLISKFNDETVALCAYNAGIGAVNSWLKQRNLSENGKKIDKIPYIETQKYVKKVRHAKKEYEKIYYKNT